MALPGNLIDFEPGTKRLQFRPCYVRRSDYPLSVMRRELMKLRARQQECTDAVDVA